MAKSLDVGSFIGKITKSLWGEKNMIIKIKEGLQHLLYTLWIKWGNTYRKSSVNLAGLHCHY